MNEKVQLSIIGGGPRGLSALENFFEVFCFRKVDILPKVLLFEKTSQYGNSPVYDVNQPNTNWLNVSERDLSINRRNEMQFSAFSIPAFPSYYEWAGYDKSFQDKSKVDFFPPRNKLGEYLRVRFESIAQVLIAQGLLILKNEKVVQLEWNNNKFNIFSSSKETYLSDEVLLCIGHQPTETDKQIAEWQDHQAQHPDINLIPDPYPIPDYFKKSTSNPVFAIRGFGLSTIDVVRAIVQQSGGSFDLLDPETRQMKFKNGSRDFTIVPFSLDGLPMGPKPLNKLIDEWFEPSIDDLNDLRQSLEQELDKPETIEGPDFLIDKMADLASEIFICLGQKAYAHQLEKAELKNIIQNWLSDESFEHTLIIPQDQAPEMTMQQFVGMACGQEAISLDYTIGQVWRHCQPMLYKVLSYSELEADVIKQLVNLDERMKRYAYGPPVDSLQQLLALVDAGVLDLSGVNNPDINLVDAGWELKCGPYQVVADVMINAVLDSPKILAVCSPIIRNLLEDKIIQPVHSELGIDTCNTGIVQVQNKDQFIPLAVLGRLAKGTLIGVDAILECFGTRSRDWARASLERYLKSIQKV